MKRNKRKIKQILGGGAAAVALATPFMSLANSIDGQIKEEHNGVFDFNVGLSDTQNDIRYSMSREELGVWQTSVHRSVEFSPH